MKPACVRFSRSTYGTVGCTVGVAPHLFVGAYGESTADALSKAGAIAAELQKRIDDDPALAVALQAIPGGAAAFKAIAAAAALYHSGASARDVVSMVGPVANNVVKSILSIF
jgi:hypothetical protein